MTTVGKILVILMLVFELGVAALCAFVYAAHTNWAESSRKYQNNFNMAEADNKVYKEDNEKLRKKDEEREKQLKKVGKVQAQGDATQQIQSMMDAKDAAVERLNTDLKAAKDALVLEQNKTAEQDSTTKALQLAEKQRQAQLEFMTKELKDARDEIGRLRTDLAAAKMDKATADAKYFTMKDRADQVEKQFAALIAENTKLKNSGGTTAGTTTVPVSPNTPNLPAFPIEGKVSKVTADGDLVQITVGSDSGLVKGHTLYAFRFSPKPQYLGQIRLVTVDAKVAVGQIMGKASSALQPGDTVSSRTAGN